MKIDLLSKIVPYIGALIFCSVSLYGATNADLSITKTPSASIVNQSTVMTYTLVVTNNDGQTSPDATVSDTLPIGMTYNSSSISSTSASTAAWSCTASGSPVVVQCSTTSLWKNSSSTITLNVTSPSSATSGVVTFNNTATVSSTTTDTVTTNNSATSKVTLNRPPVAVNDSVSTASHTAVSGNVLTNDTDLDGHSTISVVNPGTFTLSFGALTINADGSFTYTPGYFTGETDHYDYTIIDSNGVTASATLQISIGSECTTPATNPSKTGPDLCLRKQTVVFGDMKTIGNTLVVPPNPQPTGLPSSIAKPALDQTTYCSSYTTGSYYSDLNNIDNQSLFLCSYKPDGYLNATSAELDVPAGSTIKWAGLYLQSVVREGDSANLLSMDVKIKKDGGSYQNAGIPTVVYYDDYVAANGTNYDNYSAFIDVTNLFKTNSWVAGNYTIANVPVTTDTLQGAVGITGKYGAWSLVVIYEKADEKLRSVSVYDGWRKINSSTPVPVTVNNFYTPTSGDISAKVSIFVAEGDKYRVDDNFKSGTTSLGTPGNAFDSSISGTSRFPLLSNNQGIDIKTYEIGKSGLDLLNYNQSSITFSLSTYFDSSDPLTFDNYYASMLAFSTEVYHPKMCYYEDLYSGGVKLGTGAQVTSGSTIQAKVLLKNDMNEPAEKVMLYRTFGSTMPYVLNSTGYKLNPTGVTDADKMLNTTTHVTDAFTSADTFDYSSPLSLFSLHAGTGATYNQGGDFTYNQTALFDYNTTANFEGNTSIVYQIAYTMPTIGFRYEGELAKCVDFNNTFGVAPSPTSSATASFNVVNERYANISAPGGYYNNLPTQIASRADNFRVLAYEQNTITLQDLNTTVFVELVDADSGSTCSDWQPVSKKVQLFFNNQSSITLTASDIINNVQNVPDNTVSIPNEDRIFYQKAVKNARFRVSYSADGAGNMIQMVPQGTDPETYHFANFTAMAGDDCAEDFVDFKYKNDGSTNGTTTYQKVPVACGNNGVSDSSAMQLEEVKICLRCIYGAGTPSCSQDNFAIRPEAFYVKMYDHNQSNIAIKQVIANNITGPVSLNLASGYNYYAEVNATNHFDNNATDGYDATESLDAIWEPRTLPLPLAGACNDDTNKSAVLTFGIGQATANLSVDQVGEYRLNITDDTWASVDSNSSLMSHHVSPYFMTAAGSDCIINSSVTRPVGSVGLNGCNISTSDANSVAGVTYIDHNLTLHPYKFDISSIGFGVGTIPTAIAAGGNGFVYMSDMSRDDSMNMSVRATGNIVASGYNNNANTNFVTDCFAKDLNLSMAVNNNFSLANTTYQARFQDFNSTNSLIYDSNATDINTAQLGINIINIEDGNFTKSTAGSLSTVTRLNYDRNQTQPLNSIMDRFTSMGIKCVIPSECTMQADLSASHEANGSKAMDFNVTHVYGRIIPRDIRVFGSVPFSANAWYEVYNASSINGTALASSKNEAMWYINRWHDDGNDGDGNITVVNPSIPNNSIPITYDLPVSPNEGSEIYQFNAIGLSNIPYGGKAHIDTDPWLWYGVNALTYHDPDGTHLDCLTHPCFNINVVPAVGATGSAKTETESSKSNKASSKGAGTWHSTTDYAPAIR